MSSKLCVDCRRDTVAINEFYMVVNSVWARSGLGENDGMLCIGCLKTASAANCAAPIS